MNKQNLIKYWSYVKPMESLKIHDVLSKKLCEYYSEHAEFFVRLE